MTRSTTRMAWRGLWRHPRRTILMITMVAFASLMIIIALGTVDGFMGSMADSQIAIDQGSLKIRAAGYDKDPSPQHGLTPEALSDAESVLIAKGVSDYAPRLSAYGMVKSAYGAGSAEVRGIDTARESRVTTLPSRVVDGRGLEAAGEILMSRKMAEMLDVRLGERVVLLAQGESSPESIAFRAVGFFASGMPALDKSLVLVSLEDARRLTGWSGATEIAVALPRTQDADAMALQLAVALGEAYEAKSFLALNPILAEMFNIGRGEMMPLIFILALLAGFGVANTVLFSVLERTREFGVMIAVGMAPRRLARLVQVESLITSAMGFVIGGVLGYAALLAMQGGISIGSDWAAMGGDMALPTVLYAGMSAWYWLASFSVVIVTGLLAAWYPARRAAALEPVAAIRET
jgi:ABC-type lipoprotein release transport system permease subunit